MRCPYHKQIKPGLEIKPSDFGENKPTSGCDCLRRFFHNTFQFFLYRRYIDRRLRHANTSLFRIDDEKSKDYCKADTT